MPKLAINDKEKFKTIADNKDIGKRLAFYRKKRGLTQKELAEKIGIDRTVIANYEVGRAHIYDEILARLSLVLNVSVDLLLGIKGSKNKEKPMSLKIMKRVRQIEKLSSLQQKIILRNIDINIAGIKKE